MEKNAGCIRKKMTGNGILSMMFSGNLLVDI